MLEYINDPNDIKQIQPEDYKLLAKDIRRFAQGGIWHRILEL